MNFYTYAFPNRAPSLAKCFLAGDSEVMHDLRKSQALLKKCTAGS